MEININQDTQQKEQRLVEEKKKIRRKEFERFPASGLDVGTGNIVTAISKNNEAFFKLERDAFFEIEKSFATISMLSKVKANYVSSEDQKHLQIVGKQALDFADFFNKECQRPLAHGVISTREKSALTIIKLILKNLLGDPIVENENCYFSIPAKPIDKDDYNIIYHENVLKSFITSFGFNAVPLNEALAIVWSNLVEEDYIGMALSFGSGMTNVCLSYMGISEKEHQFSIARCGDWIDESVSTAVGLKASRITTIKEAGIDLLNPKTREETALKFYYENLIEYVCKGIEKKLNSIESIPNFKNPITVVISGGSSKPINFEKIFEKEIMSKSLPFKIKQIKKAKDPLNAVAEGCLLCAITNSKEQE